MSKIIVTGANGYIGSAAVAALARRGHKVSAGVRESVKDESLPTGVTQTVYGDLGARTDFRPVLEGHEIVIHTAAVAHKAPPADDSGSSYVETVNFEAVASLASAAVQTGVRQIVFLSSIAVHGAATSGAATVESSEINPATQYGHCKWKAENALRHHCDGSSTSWTIIRPAMVYGPRAPGNFSRLVRLTRTGLPLPLRRVDNKRSLLSIDGLASLIVRCVERSEACNEIFVASDAETVSTPEIIESIARGLKIEPRLWSLPPAMLKFGGRLLRVEKIVSSLLDDNVVNPDKARERLGWQPTPSTSAEIVRILR